MHDPQRRQKTFVKCLASDGLKCANVSPPRVKRTPAARVKKFDANRADFARRHRPQWQYQHRMGWSSAT
jgi:5-methylcytosine-specific restriction endonuclease McrA